MFDPNAAATEDSGVFGLPHSAQQAALVLLPVPWEVTTSYGGGTSHGPGAILAASRQVDLFDGDLLRPYEPGIHWLPESHDIRRLNDQLRPLAKTIIEAGGISESPQARELLAQVNAGGEALNAYVEGETARWLKAGKVVGVVGGDHSVPFGAMGAVARVEKSFGVLHFDAHSDTRDAYEGFQWSHASIFRNVLERLPQVETLVQVGIRDYCEEEWEYVRSQGDRVHFFADRDLARRRYQGVTWSDQAKKIVAALPQRVWVSFDVDGLDPRFCPHTGTPVPGGLDFNEANEILSEVVRSGRTLIGFDLNEVAPNPNGTDEWDANVGARLLYKLCGWTLASRKLVPLR